MWNHLQVGKVGLPEREGENYYPGKSGRKPTFPTCKSYQSSPGLLVSVNPFGANAGARSCRQAEDRVVLIRPYRGTDLGAPPPTRTSRMDSLAK